MTAIGNMKSIPGQQTSRFITNFAEENMGNTEMLKFPSTKNILWDHNRTGSDSQISISYYRKPRLCISEKVLRFAHRHVESKDQTSCGCALVGQLSIDEDGEGLVFTLDRFDPGGDSLNNSYTLSPGDLAVPFQVVLNSKNERQSSSDDYLQALHLLKQRCSSKNSIDLSNFLLTKGWCNIYTSGDKCVHHLEFDVVTMATEFKAMPITPVPIVPTALSKNLSGPMSMSHLQGEPKTGYLTMDHTRKVLLVLESDPKVANLPLVGIWVSGVSFVYSPYIWACCLRYLHNSTLNDRVCVPPEPFLLVLYNPMHSKPEFYEINTVTGNSQMNFDLFNGYEVINLPKGITSSQRSIEMDIGAVDGGQKKEKFDGAIHLLKSQKSDRHEDVPKSVIVSSADEMTPRNIPAPHRSQLPVMTSMVPEVSLLFGEDSSMFSNPKKPNITQGKPNGVSHTSDFRNKLHSNLPVLHEHPDVQQRKSASGFSAQQTMEQNYQQTNAQSGRLAQQYLNTVPKSGTPTDSVRNLPQNGVNTNSVYQDRISEPHSRTLQQESIPQMRAFTQDPNIQNRTSNSNFVVQNRNSQQTSVNNLTNNNSHINSGPSLRPQTMHPQLVQPYAIPPNRPHVPYSYGQPLQQQEFVPVPGNHGFISQPQMSTQIPPQHFTTQYSQQAPAGYPQGYSIPANHIQPQFIPQQQGMVRLPNHQQQFIPITPQNHPVSQPNIVQRNQPEQRPSPHADSSKSSDDSGLSVTPEKQNPPPKSTGKSNESEEAPDSILQSKNINWSQVPPEVYQLLVQQDAQLKKLQSQIQILINNQSNSSQNTTTTELDSQMSSASKPVQEVQTTNLGNHDNKTEMCSVAVNTSMIYPPQQRQSVSQQTSPQKSVSSRSGTSSGETTPRQGSQCSGDDGRTPAEIRHRGILPFNSTQKDDFDLDASQDLSSVVNNMALHDKTIDSIQSDMIVDMPSYHSSPTRSERSGDTLSNSQDTFSADKSPTSASMCGQQDDSGDEHEPVDTNDKEYYERLMNNIQFLLSQQSAESGMPGEITDTLQNDTLQQSIVLGQYINSIQQRSAGASHNPLETTFIPKINYMSMMFDSDSDSSMEINAMAMKYLKDEQLTQMTKLQSKAKRTGNNAHQRVTMLRHILSDDKQATPNVTTVGMSPNDMTFATRKYMEKHGLINTESRNTTADSTGSDNYQLRLNYSTMSCRSESPVQITKDIINSTDNQRMRLGNDSYKTPTRQTVGSRLTGSPFVNSQNTTNTLPNSHDRTCSPPLDSRNVTNKIKSPNIHSQTKSPFVNSQTNSPYVNSQTKSPFVNSHIKSPSVNNQMKNPSVNSHNISNKQGRGNYNFTPSPVLQSAPQQQVIREKPEVLEQNYRDRTEENYKHLFQDEDDKILDITRLRMLPKLL